MDLNDILKTIESRLNAGFPGEPVYWDRLPKGFERPSFTIEATKDETVDVNIALIRRMVTVLVTCFVSVDSYGDSSRAELNRRQCAVEAIFGTGRLAVGDRSLTVSANKGAGAPDFAEVSAAFTWTDARPGYVDPEAATPESGGAPLMEHYQINLNGKD